MNACDACLRRAYLVGHLASRIAGLLDRPGPRVGGLLALPEAELVTAAAGRRPEVARAYLEAFDPAARRAELERRGVFAVCAHDPSYPSHVRDLADPPAVLFGVGQPGAVAALDDEPAVAVVGARRASPYGLEVAHALGRGLGAAGIPVVSGLALGVDATAHRGCLAGNGLPVAVLACGADIPYPRRHRGLYQRIRHAGVVLSELPPGQPPLRWSFPARNRIMAALTALTVVVEAAEPSGSLITSEFARDLGRGVAAVPGRVTSRLSRGTNGLLRDGAVPVTGPQDVLDELFGAGVRRTPSAATSPPEPDDAVLRRVLRAAECSATVDEIAAAACLPVADTRAAIGRLEVEGFLTRQDLGGWERAAG